MQSCNYGNGGGMTARTERYTYLFIYLFIHHLLTASCRFVRILTARSPEIKHQAK